MIGSFKKSFMNKEKMNPPQEILDTLKKSIPSNLMLVKDKQKGLILVPMEGETIKGNVTFSEDVIEELKSIPQDKWLIYLYRTQKPVRVKDVVVGDDINKVPIAILGHNPLHEIDIKDCMLIPQTFDRPFTIRCDTAEGECLNINMQQVVYDSWQESKYENIDHKGIKIELILNDDDIKKSRLTYSTSPQKAKTIKEAVEAMHLFRGLINGTARINGVCTGHGVIDAKVDMKQLGEMAYFWEKALELEKKLGTCFEPGADSSGDDMKLFAELVECFINRRSITWRHPFDSFHVNGVASKKQVEDLVEKEALKYSFIEGPIHCKLLGTEFDLYSYSELKDFAIKYIDWDDNDEGAEIFIDNATDDIEWTLTRFFLTEKEKNKAEEIISSGKGLSIPKDIDNS